MYTTDHQWSLSSAHTFPPYSFKTHCNTTPNSPMVCLLPVTYQNTSCITVLPMPHTCAVHQFILPFITLMMPGEYTLWIFSLRGYQQRPLLPSLLVPNILLSTAIGRALSIRSSLNATDQVTSTHSKKKLYSSAYFNTCPFDSRRECKRF